ncbi:arginine--tRNA ligase, partial [Candidatus Saccharibacteria bacterium]|nr:arginine--tRNA ligase [Candidatus Saccharibacteria bacterium]
MQEIREQLKNAIKDLYGLADFDPELTPSPANIDADYSSNAPLKLAKELHKPPMEIAEELCDKMAQLGTFESICDNGSKLASEPCNDRRRSRADGKLAFRIEATPDGRPLVDRRERSGEQKFLISHPGFINFSLNDEYLTHKINDLFNDFSQAIALDDYKNQTIICEFSDPNPFKVLHVGHLYTSIVVDAISRLYESAGAHVIRANFGGDVGLHVAKTMYILEQKDPATLTIEDIAQCYVEGTVAYDDNNEARQTITDLNQAIYRIN